MDRLLIDHLVTSGLTSRADVQRKILKAKALKVGVLAQMFDEDLDEEKMADALAEFYDAPTIDETEFAVNDVALKFLSKKMADKHGVLPYEVSETADHVKVVVFNPESASDVLTTLKTATGSDPTITLARKSWVKGAIRHYYFGEEWAEKPIEILELEPEIELEPEPEAIPPEPPKPQAGMVGSNRIARLKPKRRTIVTPVSTPTVSPRDESAEILLDEVVATHKKYEEPQRQTDTRKPTKPGSDVDKALDDFDAFLNQSGTSGNRLVDPNLSDVPGWTSPPQQQQNGSWDTPSSASGSGFDLFSEVETERRAPSGGVEEVVHQQAVMIAQLRKDLEQQRGIIQALVDLLSESRIVSKREIKRRIENS